MKKIILIITLITNYILANDYIKKEFRVGYQKTKDKQEVALRINISAKSDKLYGFSVKGTLSKISGLGDKNQGSIGFFSSSNENYTTISQLYLKYEISDTQFILGRQHIETPFADSDSGGMIENTFEAFTIVNNSIKDTTIFLSKVKSISGVDSPNIENFVDLNGKKGIDIAGITYNGISNTIINGWFCNIDGVSKNYYTDINYEQEFKTISFGSTLQYTIQKYNNEDNSKIFGVETHINIKKMGITLSMAYNSVKGNVNANNLFGGGPFLINSQQNTLNDIEINGEIVLYSIGFDASIIGVDGLNLYTSVDSHKSKDRLSENDFVLEYAYNDKLNFAVIYSDVINQNRSFTNLRTFVNYAF